MKVLPNILRKSVSTVRKLYGLIGVYYNLLGFQTENLDKQKLYTKK